MPKNPLEASDTFRRHIEPIQDLIEWVEGRPLQTQFGYRSQNDRAEALEREAYAALSKALAMYSSPAVFVAGITNG